jgi:hypothetical protein
MRGIEEMVTFVQLSLAQGGEAGSMSSTFAQKDSAFSVLSAPESPVKPFKNVTLALIVETFEM